jgi:acyl-CoA synthetase (AMP-forming)/AMP-acid ligase II
MAAEVTT